MLFSFYKIVEKKRITGTNLTYIIGDKNIRDALPIRVRKIKIYPFYVKLETCSLTIKSKVPELFELFGVNSD